MSALRAGCAVVTGGGGLLGTGLAMRCANAGLDVLVSDIDLDAAEAVAAQVRSTGVASRAIRTDVTDPEALVTLADAAFGDFGAVSVLCLNAGLARLKPFEELTLAEFLQVFDVQFNGVLNGIMAFLPPLIAQGPGSHIVATSSMSGVGRADLRTLNAPYVTAKHAVVGLCEVMAPALAEHGIGVSILCPGMTVKDPASLAGTTWPMPSAQWYEHNILDADQVAEEVLHGVLEDRLYIFPHRAGRQEVVDRFEQLMRGFDQADATSARMAE